MVFKKGDLSNSNLAKRSIQQRKRTKDGEHLAPASLNWNDNKR
jgi:hypothetical protein